MIKIDFFNGITEDFTVVLANRNLDKQGKISNISDFVYSAKLNSADEISFSVYKYLNGKKEELWDNICDLKLVWVNEIKQYFQIKVSKTESNSNVKKVVGVSLCEAELSQTYIRNMEINSEDDIARPDYVVTKFFDPDNHDASLLHRVLSIVPHYTIKYVDKSLYNIQRTFSIDDKSIYDFLLNECAEQIGCIFQFDSTNRSISVYDLYTVCQDCGYRGEYLDICPECGSTNLYSFGEDTTILIDSEHLTDEINFETDVDSIKNCFKLKTGDEMMDAAVVACNPNGSDYIYYFSEQQKLDMPDALKEKLDAYDVLVSSYENEYQTLSKDLYDCIDKILYYQSSMMPNIEMSEVTASTEAAKLTTENLSPVGLSTVDRNTSVYTVNSAIINFVKVIVKTGYVKVEIENSNYKYIGSNIGEWTGNFKVTNYSDENDIAYSETIGILITANYKTFLQQKILKNIYDNDDADSIYDVLGIENLDNFKQALTLYSYNRLESFADAIQGVLDVLINENQGSIDSEYYDEFYTSYYNKLQACQAEMNIRSATIIEYETRQQEISKTQSAIRNILDLREFLGDTLYKLFCAYRREDTYKNENFISDGLTNSEILSKAKEFIHLAKQEIVKSGEYQHSISANLYNLLVIPKFEPLRDHFELGNWMRCKVDDTICKLRLTAYEINGKSLSNINTEFSDVMKTSSGISDIKNILQNTQSIATSYQYVSKQAEQAEKINSQLIDIENKGLNSALINIKNSDNQELIIDKHGALCRKYDDVLDKYDDEQLKIINNQIVMTEDNWQTATLAIGKHKYVYYDKYSETFKNAIGYGVSSKFLNAPYIYGGQIISGDLYSDNYSVKNRQGSYMNLRDGTFSLGGGNLSWDGNALSVKSKETLGIMSSGDIYEYNNEYGEINYYDYGEPQPDESIAALEIYLDLATGKLYRYNRYDFDDEGFWSLLTVLPKKNDILFENKVSKGDVSSQISIESGEVSLKGNRFTVESDNFKLSGSGEANLIGTMQTKNENGSYINVSGHNITFYSDNNETFGIGRVASTSDPNIVASCLYTTSSGILFGVGSSTSGKTSYYVMNNGSTIKNSTSRHIFEGDARFLNSIYTTHLKIFDDTSGESSYDGSCNLYRITYSDGNYGVGLNGKGLYVYGELACSGTKYRLVDTENYGTVGMNAVESASAHFTDFGSGVIINNKCYVYIDSVFMETIDTNEEYQVLITRTSEKETSWVEKHSNYFIVHGESGATFDWMLIAKQKGYQLTRMERVDITDNNGIQYDESIFYQDDYSAMQSESYANEIAEQIQSVEDSLINDVIDKNNEQNTIF